MKRFCKPIVDLGPVLVRLLLDPLLPTVSVTDLVMSLANPWSAKVGHLGSNAVKEVEFASRV